MSAKTVNKATIFDIERYATKDGPGIRTVIFFKGCNLRCLWCQNPESQKTAPQIMYFRNKCIGCSRCLEICPQKAISEDPVFGLITDHNKCTACGKCSEVCFSDARRLIGNALSAEEVMIQIRRDNSFYRNSGGGVTFSGGEPLLQSDFIMELARMCREEGIHTTLETAGLVSLSVLKSVSELIDLIYFDLKHIDRDRHYANIGVYPEQIQENLKWLSRHHKNLIIRIPVIPDVNSSREDISAMFRFIKEQTAAQQVELLAFHRLGLGKYEGLGMEYAMGSVPNLDESVCEEWAEIGRLAGLKVHTGAN